MSLDISFWAVRLTCVFDSNITHNLAAMADEAGIYDLVWLPEEHGISKAGELVAPLNRAIADMVARPDHYRQFDDAHGWGTLSDLIPWLRALRDACAQFPDAKIEVSR